ncbi:MAG TPA: zf-HC2 domain-containing protein [Blastocatellia bacterium]|nr:zf-HC2 domain-containing protein [Blastocatellia bacterium]
MQALDCRNLKDLLDSYLSDELSVETNHAVLRHVEQCPACRTEMAARRDLREGMRRAGTQLRLSAEGRERLRERLRAEAPGQTPAQDGVRGSAREQSRESFFKRLLSDVFAPLRGNPILAAALTLLLTLGLGYGLFLFRPHTVAAAELSREFMSEAIGDHDYCAPQFRDEESATMAEDAKEYDPAYADLDRIAEVGAQGMKLRAAHVCSFAGRSFAHLVYTRGDDLISLLVTERNAKAMKNGVVPDDDGLAAGLQQEIRGDFRVSAYQTRRHVVLVVTTLSDGETKALAEKIARPVSDHLRNVEVKSPQPAPHK